MGQVRREDAALVRFSCGRAGVQPMGELMRSNDAVLMSYAADLLAQNGIPHHVADAHMSVLEGSLGILARRLLVAEADRARARQVLIRAGLGAELRPDG